LYAPNIPFGIVVAGAIAVSAASSRQLAAVAIGLAAGWLNYVASWDTPNAAMIFSTLIDTDSVDLWSIFNGLNAALCLHIWHENGRKPDWAILLYVLLLSGCYFDVLWWGGWVSWASFKGAVDLIFVSEMALLYVVGGPHALDRVCRGFARWRDLGALRAAFAAAPVSAWRRRA